MAIAIKETFVVQAPIERVWQFVMDPKMVVTCMPGAELVEVVTKQRFSGRSASRLERSLPATAAR